MRTNIHPTWYPNATITCSCGSAFTVGSTRESIHVELCSACHPFYTGAQKIVDSARRVDRFQQRAAKQTAVAATRTGRRVKRTRDLTRRKARGEAITGTREEE